MTIIMRSALIFHGCQVSNDLHSIVDDGCGGGRRIITWADVMRWRRERQARILAHKRFVESWRAVRVTVGYFGDGLMGGWNAFVEDLHHRTWIDRDGRWYGDQLMKLFPLRLPIGSEWEQWDSWKQDFARRYERRRQLRKPFGVAFMWRKGNDLALVKEA